AGPAPASIAPSQMGFHPACGCCPSSHAADGFWKGPGSPEHTHSDFQPRIPQSSNTWHPEHFACARCGQELGGRPFFERGGRAYCEEDYHQAFSPRCAYCAGPIREVNDYLSALQGVWHPECFVCAECLSSFGSGSFFELEGRPYCELHFHQRQGSICHGCGHPVTGRCITAAGRKYHPEHFICAYCLGQLQKGTVREHGEKMYCQACHDKLFL
uniref:Leupaxin n=1 Tax=Calidris pygmaea TaxID=425635 RepID=A0A8C3JGE7_9CHAR